MEKTNDKISQLPDDFLHYILSLMPMKFIVRTSILSRRWRNLWKPIWAYTTALDFGAEFATGQTPEEFVATVNRYLLLHKGKEIEMFRIMFIPCNLSNAKKWVEFIVAKQVKWVKFAVAKQVKELHINFCQIVYFLAFELVFCKLLDSIFSCDSITHLNLSHFHCCSPLDFKGYTYLKTLHLSDATVTDALFESMLSNCPLLEELSLKRCYRLTHIKVSSLDQPLKSLTVVDCSVHKIEIFAPNLQSFHFYGDFTPISFKNNSSLVDVLANCICRGGYCSDWITFLHLLEHVKILTLCKASLELPSPLTKYPFQRDYQYEELLAEDPPEIVFDHLKVIKMNGFRGLKEEMQLVKFFLEKATVLESLVLVASQKAARDMKKNSASKSKSADTPLGLLRDQLLILAKAASPYAQILICEYSDDDGALAPTHTEGHRKKWLCGRRACFLEFGPQVGVW